MSNSVLEKPWRRWYPKKIFLKEAYIQKKILYQSDKFIETDFLLDIQEKEENNIHIKDRKINIDLKNTEAYKMGFKKGFSESSKENIIFKNKLNDFFLDFENSFSMFENVIYSRLIKIVLTISSYVIGKNIDIDQSILLNNIKKIVNQDSFLLKKPILIVHPNNKIMIEKKFQNLLERYKWKLVYDESVDLNSYKVKSESGDIDATVNARWQELFRLINSKEY